MCFVREHIAAVEIGYAATSDVEPAAIGMLCRRQAHETFHRGAGGKVPAGSKLEHTEVATFSYTLVLVSVAVP